MPESPGNSEIASFVVSGAAFIRARKNLKPAYPKKKQIATAMVGFVATSTNEVSIQLAGASAKMPAIVSRSFTAQMPWMFFQQLVTEQFDDAATIQFQVCNGVFKYGDTSLKSSQILFRAEKIEAKGIVDDVGAKVPTEIQPQPNLESSDDPPLPDLMSAPLGLPLLGAYSYRRKYGFRELLGNRAFVSQEIEVITILRKAGDLLRPLGISREDLETMIDERLGVSGNHPIDGSR
jgi:hypothetical protein